MQENKNLKEHQDPKTIKEMQDSIDRLDNQVEHI